MAYSPGIGSGGGANAEFSPWGHGDEWPEATIRFLPILGETKDEVLQVMDDLMLANVDFLTVGQYLQPTVKHFPLKRYVHPDEFQELKELALSKGFLIVASSPLTRSSYHADEDFSKMKILREKQAQCHPLQ